MVTVSVVGRRGRRRGLRRGVLLRVSRRRRRPRSGRSRRRAAAREAAERDQRALQAGQPRVVVGAVRGGRLGRRHGADRVRADRPQMPPAGTRRTLDGPRWYRAPRVRAPVDSIPAPPFPRHLPWVNVAPLRMDKQSGRPVLIEFWDFCRPNSMRTLPYVQAWHERYAADGLRV